MNSPHIDFANYQKLLTKNYYIVRNYRTDAWISLKHFSDLLAENEGNEEFVGKLKNHIVHVMEILETLECYWAFPGLAFLKDLWKLYENEDYKIFAAKVSEMRRLMVGESYRWNPSAMDLPEVGMPSNEFNSDLNANERKHYFEVLVVDNVSEAEEDAFRERLKKVFDPGDRFVYKVLFVRTFQDALIALNFNHYIQSCIIRYGIPGKSNNNLNYIKRFTGRATRYTFDNKTDGEIGLFLARTINEYRPRIDLFYVTDTSLDNLPTSALQIFRRIFYRQEDLQEMHLSIKRGVLERFNTPFFTALVNYSQKPTGVFHAMPVSRGNSVFRSNWIRDMGDFYGRNIFLAETSATTGGLDSLLQPKGPLKEAQKLAADAFGSQHTFFVTNGTSTANKIVLQALVQPDDVILIDRDCHKSHHYGLILSGAYPVYLDSYPIPEYSMYGAVPLEEILKILNEYKEAGELHRVKMLILTNCTFDGMVYNVRKVMQQVLAIKPDMMFLWDEAWFGYARFFPTFRKRTGMHVASKLSAFYRSKAYKERYQRYIQEPDTFAEELKYMPDPDKVKVRVYSTQSTHKTLTSLRQGSMIHVHDQDFNRIEAAFHEAYMTHTSTSPNYQILASLDVGRRQTMFEGPELVEKSIETAIMLRVKIYEHTLLSKYFDVLTVSDFIPDKYRTSNLFNFYDCNTLWASLDSAWENDEFVLDPSKITLFIGKTGIDGDVFKRQFLMDEFNIQVNKTTGNTVLFMTNIGTTRSSAAYLVSVLVKIATKLEQMQANFNKQERLLQEKKVKDLCENYPPLPNFSYFHSFFKREQAHTPEGDMRKAYFMSYNEDFCTYMTIADCEQAIQNGQEVVSASFVTPYPPGFPVLVPGQVITNDILDFMKALSIDEIHSYRKELGFKVFTQEACKKEEAPIAVPAVKAEAETGSKKAPASPKKGGKKEGVVKNT